METVGSWGEVGERIAEARQAAGMNQTELATKIGLERTALVRIESGDRKVSAIELFRMSEVLEVPAAHFMARPPTPLVSRRQGLEEDSAQAARARFRFDALLETHARDAAWLVDRGFLVPPSPLVDGGGRGSDAAESAALAREVRKALGREHGALGGMAGVAERFGLYITSLDAEGEGASLLLDGFGVAVLGGQAEPGRRRWTAAHELGHHLLQDEYHSDLGVAASRDQREEVIDRFTEELLVPDVDLQSLWHERARSDTVRDRLIAIAADYRVSWSVIVRKASRLGLVDAAEVRHLRARIPTRGDIQLVHGSDPVPDLPVGATGPQWRKAVLDAWTQGSITGPRTVELLKGALTLDELPLRSLEEPAP